ncbi:hypothetical protein JAAARDRAFT_139235 [Jaapia argillacea MUCL 33604]|uniref:Uncharacterized protein n=1 Tax=Jaapia argillacea MUCL 33604 TaxID=933084 RepID=A0A067PM30_9AGAM|nr:hypothetical protein JAAARDRAFT_139235 [Jaapia argillacea MUCL 33604]
MSCAFGDRDPLTHMDTSLLGINHRYVSFHCSNYNHHSTQGHEAPPTLHPLQAKKVNVKHTNYTQMVPRLSVETHQYSVIYRNVCNVLADLFRWEEALIQRFFPKDFKTLSEYCELLPLDDMSPVYPMSSLVLNLDVATNGHRDSKDIGVCVVVAWAPHKRGELCVKEIGVVIRTRPVASVIFCSDFLTHFNLHFEGKRGSVVLHADGAFEQWKRDRNGWQDNQFMT